MSTGRCDARSLRPSFQPRRRSRAAETRVPSIARSTNPSLSLPSPSVRGVPALFRSRRKRGTTVRPVTATRIIATRRFRAALTRSVFGGSPTHRVTWFIEIREHEIPSASRSLRRRVEPRRRRRWSSSGAALLPKTGWTIFCRRSSTKTTRKCLYRFLGSGEKNPFADSRCTGSPWRVRRVFTFFRALGLPTRTRTSRLLRAKSFQLASIIAVNKSASESAREDQRSGVCTKLAAERDWGQGWHRERERVALMRVDVYAARAHPP